MDSFLTDNLEDYLAKRLMGERLSEFERRLANDPEAGEQVREFERTAEFFDAVRWDDDVELDSGFYYRVSARIEQEQEDPFWMVFLQPFLVRRLAFAALMWLFLLGSAAVFHDDTTARSTQLADMILDQQPPTDHFYVRMGPNLDQNRASMLAVMMTPGER